MNALTAGLTGNPSPSIRLREGETVIKRETCWRPACRATWGAYSTVTFTASRIYAHCHRKVHDDLGYRVDLSQHGEVAA